MHDPKQLTVQDLLHWHANEKDNCTEGGEEAKFHDEAVSCLGDVMQLAANYGDGLIDVRVDAIVGVNKVAQGWRELRLPTLPMPGEPLMIDGERLGIQARAHEVNGDRYVCCLLVGRVVQGPGLVAAGAGALDNLPPPGGLILNGKG